jgi:tripartite-type tricarboxylate transporter receptor subunit TctC
LQAAGEATANDSSQSKREKFDMRVTRKLLTFAACCLWVASATGPASSQSAAEFYKGKTITALSEFAEDATMTVFSRIVAPYLEKYTGANVIVKPTPGGGGRLARNGLYTAKPDGLTVILVAHGPKLITDGLFKLQGVRYDWAKFVPLGKIIAANSVVIVGKNSAWKTPRDPANEKFNYGESSPFYGPLFAEALGWEKMTVSPGYRSTTGRAVAISRGEIQAATAGNETVTANPDLVKGLVSSSVDKAFPNVPSVAKSFMPGRAKWVQYVEGWSDIMYVSIAPPGTPADRAAFLEAGLKKTWEDPGFRAGLQKVKDNPSDEFISMKTLTEFMKSLAALSPKDVEEMKFVLTEKYKKK